MFLLLLSIGFKHFFIVSSTIAVSDLSIFNISQSCVTAPAPQRSLEEFKNPILLKRLCFLNAKQNNLHEIAKKVFQSSVANPDNF
jgi:hypothetical protein